MTSSVSTLIGRELEIETLEALLGQVGERGGAVLIKGEAGVGKSVLLAAASQSAERKGMQVRQVSGVRSEMSVPFAGVQQILRPLLEQARGLSHRHRQMLLASFGMDSPMTSDTFAIAVATLELLAEVTKKTPLLVAVDDGHWLDSESAEVLGFVARRLGPEPVAFLVVVGEGYGRMLVSFNLPELRIEALDESSAGALLDSRAPGITAGLRARILAEAAGNPMALVDLPAAQRSERSVFGRPERLPITAQLERTFAERFLYLSPAIRALLLVAAIEEAASVSEILAATDLMGDDCSASIDDLGPAAESGLVDLDHGHINFRHPLIPAAIYQIEFAARRWRAHAALANVLVDDRYRRIWHRAASITGPDELIAEELEVAAFSPTGYGEPAARVAALERAAELTADRARRQQRLLCAGELALDLGQIDRANQLLGEVNPGACGPVAQARIRLVRSMLDTSLVTTGPAVDSLIDAAMQVRSSGETDLSLRLLRAAALCSWWGDMGSDVRDRIVAATRREGTYEEEPTALSILAMTDAEGIGDMLNCMVSRTTATNCDADTAFGLGTALHVAGAFANSAIFLAEAIGRLRRQGSVWRLPEALTDQAWNAICTGNRSAATAAAEEATKIALDLGQPLWEAAAKAALSVISAIRGETRVAESWLAEAEAIAVPVAASAVLADTQLGRAIVALDAGCHEEAFDHLQRTFDPHDPAHHHTRSAWRVGEFAEMAVYAGRTEDAREQLAICERTSRCSPSPHLQVGIVYARPLLADDVNAEALFQASLREDLTSWPLHQARLLLQYGTWLRRHRKIAQARIPLRAARDSLAALGATAWADRARQELRASRETQLRGPGAWMQLTNQELQIAHMAADGQSNRQIGNRLYISPRTVGSHLYHIFPKLGVTTRGQLSAVLKNSRLTEAAC